MNTETECNNRYGYFRTLQENQALNTLREHEAGGFFILSFKRRPDSEEDFRDHLKLRECLKLKGLKYIELQCSYHYADGRTADELSMFVPFMAGELTFDDFISISRSLGNEYVHEPVAAKYPDDFDKGKIVLLHTDSEPVKIEIIQTETDSDKVSAAYRKMKRDSSGEPSFSISGLRSPANHINAYQLRSEGVLF